MRIPDESAAGICGLFCGTCPSYPEECHGCLSDLVKGSCVNCVHGFRTCAQEQGVQRCFECAAFPCRRLEAFSKIHIVNGICHHENVIRDLREMGEIGVMGWVERQTERHTCPLCGELKVWYENPHVCKKEQ